MGSGSDEYCRNAKYHESAIENKVRKVVDVSTDKAVDPFNLYGVTKACGENLSLLRTTFHPTHRLYAFAEEMFSEPMVALFLSLRNKFQKTMR